jgi:hypothetical protein
MHLARILPAAAIFAAIFAAPAVATAPPVAAGVVHDDGTLARGFGIVSSSRDDTGAYTVTFTNTAVSDNCAYTASIGDSGTAISPPGAINVAAVSNGTIRVLTYDTHGNAADRGFHVYVAC